MRCIQQRVCLGAKEAILGALFDRTATQHLAESLMSALLINPMSAQSSMIIKLPKRNLLLNV